MRAHTCSELTLRIPLWNASNMQTHSIYIWQEWVGDETRENGESNHRQICMTEGSAQTKLLTNIRS